MYEFDDKSKEKPKIHVISIENRNPKNHEAKFLIDKKGGSSTFANHGTEMYEHGG